jgi:hypothetical protein
VLQPFRRRRFDKRLLICSFLIGCGIVIAIIGVQSSVTGRAAEGLPAAIENVDPVKNAQAVPAQTAIFVDLLAGYTGEFVVDGVQLQTVDLSDLGVVSPKPGQQVTLPKVTIYEPGNATLTFQPTKGAAVEELAQGTHAVTVRYWKLTEGRQASHVYSWTFTVF